MAKVSAGVLAWRRTAAGLEVLLAHPGGPLFADRDLGVWTIPKGELEAGEGPLDAALREFVEETGFPAPPRSTLVALGTVTQKSGKVVHAFATPHDVDPALLNPGHFTMEWPRGSGCVASFPEVDRVAWFPLSAAASRLNPAQVAFLARLPA